MASIKSYELNDTVVDSEGMELRGLDLLNIHIVRCLPNITVVVLFGVLLSSVKHENSRILCVVLSSLCYI